MMNKGCKRIFQISLEEKVGRDKEAFHQGALKQPAPVG
jgi:hypothetical protein